MAFTLRITFSGMCLFVPEPSTPGGSTGRMHVLMPGMSGHHHHCGLDRHVPMLSYDAGSLVQGGPLLGVRAVARFTGHELVPVEGDAASTALCGHIVDLKQVTGRPVDPDHLNGDIKKKLAARVTLGAGGITRVAPGVCWEWRPGEFRPIAHQVEWEIPNVQGDSLTLHAEPIGGGGAPKVLGTLYPSNGLLSLEVLHEPVQDVVDPVPVHHQEPPMRGQTPPHFTAFYDLFGGPVPVVLPRYWGPLEEAPAPSSPCAILPPAMGAMPYTCLVGGA